MKRVRCSHCRSRLAKTRWTLRACAVGRALKVRLCRRCDVALNIMVVRFARLRGGAAIIKRYERRMA